MCLIQVTVFLAFVYPSALASVLTIPLWAVKKVPRHSCLVHMMIWFSPAGHGLVETEKFVIHLDCCNWRICFDTLYVNTSRTFWRHDSASVCKQKSNPYPENWVGLVIAPNFSNSRIKLRKIIPTGDDMESLACKLFLPQYYSLAISYNKSMLAIDRTGHLMTWSSVITFTLNPGKVLNCEFNCGLNITLTRLRRFQVTDFRVHGDD